MFEKVKTSGVENLPGEYLCEAIDTKETEDVVKGSTLWVLDSKEGFVFDGTAWREV